MRYSAPGSPRGRYDDPTCASATKAVEHKVRTLHIDPSAPIEKEKPRWKYYVPVKYSSAAHLRDPAISNVAVRQLLEAHRYVRQSDVTKRAPLTSAQQAAMTHAQRYEIGLCDRLKTEPARNVRYQELNDENVPQIKALLSGRYTPVVEEGRAVVHYPTLNKLYVHDASEMNHSVKVQIPKMKTRPKSSTKKFDSLLKK